MKKLLTSMLLSLLFAFSATAEEISLFNSDGQPVAYIDADDTDLTVYMWNGTPVAYLTSAYGDYFNIYGFNGSHLGWYEKGCVVDHSGYIVGFCKGAVSKYTAYEPYKSYKKYKPYKSAKRYAPAKPYTHSIFSSESLSLFLMKGRNQ